MLSVLLQYILTVSNAVCNPVLVSTPWLDVYSPTGLVCEFVRSRRIWYDVRIPFELAQIHIWQPTYDFYTTNFGPDRYHSWTSIYCWLNHSTSYSWPFANDYCGWANTTHDVIILICCIGIACIGLGLAIAWYFGVLYEPLFDHAFGSIYISLLAKCCAQPAIPAYNVRSTFCNIPSVHVSHQSTNHTHPRSAASRNNATNQCKLTCAALGTTPYFYQQSKSNQRQSLDGCRTYFWAKDLASEARTTMPPKNSTLCFIDVDHYCDMPYLLAAYPGQYLISTVQPSSAAYTGPEYQFTFDQHNSIVYTVAGGAVYKHQIWNYNSDVIVATTRSWTCLWYYITVYNVDRRQIDENHQLICLSPISHLVSPLFDLSRYVGGNVLSRLKAVHGDFIRLDILKPNGLHRSTARVGSYASTTIPVEMDDALGAVSRMTNVSLTMAQVRTTTGITDVVEAAALAEYHRSEAGSKPDIVVPVAYSVNRYQYNTREFDPEAKNKLKPFMSPILPGCYSPDSTKGNDEAAVRGRVTDVASPDLEITPFMQKCMEEFVGHLIPAEHYQKHYPVDLDTVYEKQNRPAQRALLKRAEAVVGKATDDPVATFQKAEAYQKAGEPRIITTIPEINKLHYSSFIYSFTQALRATDWYAFGKTPLEMAGRVVAVCSAAIAWILKTDFSRMDGRISNVFRVFERMAMLAWFHPSCHARIIELMETQQNRVAYTQYGVKYDTKAARLSGSPETADFNSMEDALVAYTSYRRKGLIPLEAWRKLGMFGGDDGITADLPAKTFIECAEMYGQKLEVERVEKGDAGVQMLSREYGPAVWYGDPSSMCDFKRMLSKFHTTTTLPPKVSAKQKFCVKAFASYLTDANTPVVGELGKLAIECFPELIVQAEEDVDLRRQIGSYFSNVPKDVQFPNVFGEWMYDVIKRDVPTFDFMRFKGWVSAVRDGTRSVLEPPMCADTLEEKHEAQKHDVVINGDVVVGQAKQAVPGKGKACDVKQTAGGQPAAFKSKTPCKHYLTNTCSWGDKCKFAH